MTIRRLIISLDKEIYAGKPEVSTVGTLHYCMLNFSTRAVVRAPNILLDLYKYPFFSTQAHKLFPPKLLFDMSFLSTQTVATFRSIFVLVALFLFTFINPAAALAIRASTSHPELHVADTAGNLGLSTGGIIAIVCAVVVAICICVFIYKKCNKKK
ncbi:hypothetical protein CPB86DRAFT_791289 [Serendipita vermifera]|nr:hypothetical protein CPB86DRAFT_791289 [Serendipita vermifera]